MAINRLALLILGFDESYTPTRDELAQAFRAACLKFHPDTGGNATMFRGLSLAKEIVEANLPVAEKPTQSSTHSKSFSYRTNDQRIEELYNKLIYWARMATINLSGGITRVKKITVTAEGIGTLTVICTNKWEVDNVYIPSEYQKTEDVLEMYKTCLAWLSDKPRRKYKQSGHITFRGREIKIQFNYKVESSWNHVKAFFHTIF
jgi:hypothetical protein